MVIFINIYILDYLIVSSLSLPLSPYAPSCARPINTADNIVNTYAWIKATNNSKRIHKDVEQYRSHCQRSVQSRSHTCRDKYQAGKHQHCHVPCQHIGKKTDHQSKRFCENSEELDKRHHRHRYLQPPGYIRPENIFPICLSSKNINGKECTDSQYHCDCNISGHICPTREIMESIP